MIVLTGRPQQTQRKLGCSGKASTIKTKAMKIEEKAHF